ncbi:MAG TPA: cyclodeaminase/cyclohydrolase family protein [Blastocatellia bacterium]|nr:cyclodeaminase/cyclohydrolase family protein [Blastocatellia bacterium]
MSEREKGSGELITTSQNEQAAPPRDIHVAALKLSESIGLFPELVAAGTPTPGGGSVAAQSGVLAASLGQMMCNITIGKKKFAEAETRLKEIRDELDRLCARLRELIEEDAASFEAVLRAYRLPKETEDQKRERAAQIETAMRGAVDIPFETAERSFQVLKHLRELADIGNPNALSDVGVGALLAQAAVKGASYNVYVNLSALSDREASDRVGQKMTSLIDEARTIAEEIEGKMKT